MKRLAWLLGEEEDRVTAQINMLEEKNGYPSHDVRHLAENVQKTRFKVADLGLDPNDTTAEELFHALMVKFEKDSNVFDIYFNAKSLDFNKRLSKAIDIVAKNIELPQQWALKNSVSKDLLRKNLPKKLMKKLGYRSVESFLKRENLSEILLAAEQIESLTWQKTFSKAVSKLSQTDFELRELKFLQLNKQKWSGILIPDVNVLYSDVAATAVIWRDEELIKAPLLTIVLLLLEAIEPYQEINSTKTVAKITECLDWWVGMDHLVAEMKDGPISLSLKDVAQNSLHKNFLDHSIKYGRKHFWQELVNRYENLPQLDGLFDHSVKERISSLKFAAPEPAYAFAEDF
jgi:hypothetical protein